MGGGVVNLTFLLNNDSRTNSGFTSGQLLVQNDIKLLSKEYQGNMLSKFAEIAGLYSSLYNIYY